MQSWNGRNRYDEGAKRPVFKVVGAVLALCLGSGTVDAARAQSGWADSVRQHLLANGLLPPPVVAAPAVGSGPRPVTVWARSVEQRLALRARRVADAGRSALAWSESGIASWYGGRRVGHRTSSGERFDPMELTCAHPTLPLGTKVLVTSENTGRSVVVTVNDRGPFGGRIIDLSRAAAQRIGMLGSGTASVTVQQATPEVVEVAQAANDDTSAQAIATADEGSGSAVNPSPRDPQRMLRGSR